MKTQCHSTFFAILALGMSALQPSTAQTAQDAPTMTDDPTRLSLERLFESPSLSGATPRGVTYSPDGARVTFLQGREDDQARLDLWQFDTETGERSLLVDSTLLEPEEVELSEEEKALRERKRIAGQRGIVQYDWGTADTILVPLGGDLHLVRLKDAGPETQRLTETEAFEYDAKVSPGGRYVSFVRDGAVFAIDLEKGGETQLTPDPEPENAIAYGVAEFVAQEEMSRYTGYWWSPDDRYLVYTRVDESTVDIIPRFDIRAEDVTVIEQRYPRAGRPNAIIDLFVRDMKTGEVKELDWREDGWGSATQQYLARVNWVMNRDRATLVVQAVNRAQSEIVYKRAVAPNWALVPMSTERQENWVNLSKDLRDTGSGILTTTENTGFRHIERWSYFGGGVKQITSGDWVVSNIVGVDRQRQLVYFLGFYDSPLERHLYRVSYAQEGARPYRVTPRGSYWNVTMAPDGKTFVGTSSTPSQPPQTGLYEADGERITWIEENSLNADHPYMPYLGSHTVPVYGTLEAEDGQTLHYSMQLPPDFDASKTYPVIVEVYGGPHVQTVTRNWERTTDQFYTHQGYIVFRLDNRGSWNRGKAFEDVIYLRTGGPEVRDQLVGVNWLKDQPFVDPDRIAIQGWSYGGYMTLMTLLQAPPGTFAAAVSGAPVTDWTLYDTFYTERYMSLPQTNPVGYRNSSVFPYVENLETPLLLMHGMADDNVTFDNTTRLMAELQTLGKTFDLMTYPGQRHGIRGRDLQTHLMKTRMAFLNRHLKGE